MGIGHGFERNPLQVEVDEELIVGGGSQRVPFGCFSWGLLLMPQRSPDADIHRKSIRRAKGMT